MPRLMPGRSPAVHQVLGNLGLPVDGDCVAGQLLEVDAMADAFNANLRSVMHEAVAVHAGADARLVEEVDCDLLDHAGADAAEHMLAGVSLDNNIVNSVVMQELTEQKAGRAGADNDNLRPHGSPSL